MGSMLEIFGLNEGGDAALVAKIESAISVKEFKKGTMLQRQGEPAKAFFVRKGLLRSYTVDEKGKEHVFMFAPENWVISDIESHAKVQPAELYIDCLEDSELELVDMDLLVKSGVNVSKIGGIDKLLRRVAVLQTRVIMLMSATALERYQHFIETYPNIVNRVPQKMIASYLGITPEALSKIKADQLRAGL